MVLYIDARYKKEIFRGIDQHIADFGYDLNDELPAFMTTLKPGIGYASQKIDGGSHVERITNYIFDKLFASRALMLSFAGNRDKFAHYTYGRIQSKLMNSSPIFISSI